MAVRIVQGAFMQLAVRIAGPAYYSAITSKGDIYIATTVEDKVKHRSILYKSEDGHNWNEVKEFRKDHFNARYLGYGLVEFISGQELLPKLQYNLVNLVEY